MQLLGLMLLSFICLLVVIVDMLMVLVVWVAVAFVVGVLVEVVLILALDFISWSARDISVLVLVNKYYLRYSVNYSGVFGYLVVTVVGCGQ